MGKQNEFNLCRRKFQGCDPLRQSRNQEKQEPAKTCDIVLIHLWKLWYDNETERWLEISGSPIRYRYKYRSISALKFHYS